MLLLLLHYCREQGTVLKKELVVLGAVETDSTKLIPKNITLYV